MVSSGNFLMEILARKAKIERKALSALRFSASTICVSPQYEYVGGVVL